MKNLDFDWQINEFMVYCRSAQLKEKSMDNAHIQSQLSQYFHQH